MERFIKRIQMARRTFYDGEGRYPQDDEVAELTGLSLENVRLARKCSRVGGSLDKEMVDGWRTKFMVSHSHHHCCCLHFDFHIILVPISLKLN